MLKNTAFANRLGALLLIRYLDIWSSVSTHANQISFALHHFWKIFCGIYNFYFFVHWDQDAHNISSLTLQAARIKISEHAMACFSLPALRLVPVVVVFMQSPQLLFFFCLRSSASFRTWWSSCHLWQYNPYSDKATKRDHTTTNNQQLFDKQTYTTSKYQSSFWFPEEN